MTPTPLLLLGREHVEKGSTTLRELDPHLVAATTAGEGPSLNPKLVPNEDAAAVVPLPEARAVAALVADSHFGASASEIVARHFVDRIAARPAPPTTAEELASLLIDLDGRIAAEMPEGESSATTALAVVVADGFLLWASVGDSLLLHQAATAAPPAAAAELRRLDRPTSIFLGGVIDREQIALEDAVSPERIVTTGAQPVAPGDVVLLASDGLEEQTSGLTLARAGEILGADGPLAGRVGELMTRGGRSSYGGGRDNLTVVAIEVAP